MPDQPPLAVEHASVKTMSAIERSEAQLRVAMTDPQHLKEWVRRSGRTWMVLNGLDLVDALPFPEGAQALVQVIQCYRDHRATKATGRTEQQVHPVTKEQVGLDIMKTEELEIEEIDRAIRYLIGKASTIDPNWSLDGTPL